MNKNSIKNLTKVWAEGENLGDISVDQLNEITDIISLYQNSIVQSEVGDLEGATVLVVDDEPAIHRVIQRILKSLGITIIGAINSVDAAKKLRGKTYDLIISDLHMHGGDGVALLEHLKEINSKEPVIMLSGAPTVESALAAVNHKVFSYMTKPFDVDELRRLVTDAIFSSRSENIHPHSLTPEKKSQTTLHFEAAIASLWIAKQPIVNIRRNSVGFEVLLRNEEPALKNPEAFWACAKILRREEELSELARFQVMELMAYHPHHTFFYNLHYAELNGSFFRRNDNPLHALSNRLVLEISDRKEVTDNQLEENVMALRTLGYRFAIDNFGAGGADLEKLFNIRPDYIKLDRTLTHNVNEKPENEKLIKRFLEICNEINIKTIAEGVEYQADFLCLKKIGVEIFQGFLFGRPVA